MVFIFHFHLVIFTGKTDVTSAEAERHFVEQKIWDTPGHSWPSKHTGEKNHTQPPQGRLRHRTTKGKTGDALQFAYGPWSGVCCIHKAL